MSSDFFKKLLNVFESERVDEVSDKVVDATTKKRQQNNADGKDAGSEKLLKNYKHVDDREVRKAGGKSSRPDNVKETATDFFRRYSDIVTEAENITEGNNDPLIAKLLQELKQTGVGISWDGSKLEFSKNDNDKVWEVYQRYINALRSKSYHASNIERSTTSPDMMYISITAPKGMNESYGDDDEDPDVAKAMSVKGKDGKKQSDVEKKNKWSFDKKLDKADKKAEEKGAKKAAKDKDLTESKKTKVELKAVNESYDLDALEDKLESLKDDLDSVMGDSPGDDRNRSLIRSEIRDVQDKIKSAKDNASNVTESWDDDDEDPDVAKAMSVKGKDGKTQKDADKKLPPWLNKSIDKADKKAEEKGAKKAAKEKVDESVIAPKRQWIKNSDINKKPISKDF